MWDLFCDYTHHHFVVVVVENRSFNTVFLQMYKMIKDTILCNYCLANNHKYV